MKKLLVIFCLLFASPAFAGSWSLTVASCGLSPSAGTISSGSIDELQIIAVKVTTGTGTVTSCQFNLATDGTVEFVPGSVPSCLALDQTAGTVLTPSFSAVLTAQPFSYGSVTLTSAASMPSHALVMWCMR